MIVGGSPSAAPPGAARARPTAARQLLGRQTGSIEGQPGSIARQASSPAAASRLTGFVHKKVAQQWNLGQSSCWLQQLALEPPSTYVHTSAVHASFTVSS